MSEHLSPERVFEAIAGRRNAEVEEHLRVCSFCDAEVGQLRNSIAGLSQAVHSVTTPPINWAELRPQSRTRQFTWIVAAAMIAMAVALPVYEKTQSRQNEAMEADAGLLEEVDAQLSREVPASMQSLMELMREDKE